MKSFIPRTPMTQNIMLGKHWTERRQDKKAWKILVRKMMGLGDAKRKRKVCITVYRAKLQDPDNMVGSVKHVLDALVFWNHLIDDNPKCLDLKVYEFAQEDKAKRGTLIEILDIDPEAV